MFGIAKPCRHQLTPALRREWMGHLCGLCLALRDGHGQASRVTTNVDAVVLSILTDAQRDLPLARVAAGPCPLRGMRPAMVVAADEPVEQHAVAVSLTMAATKVADHANDGDGWVGRVSPVSRGVARRWSAAGERAGHQAGFSTQVLRDAVNDSNQRERRHHLSFDDYVAPTEEAAAAALAHTGVLAGRPDNLDALRRMGRAFGRITYLLDAVDDEADDLAAARFNALVEVCPDPAGRRALADTLFADSHRSLARAFGDLSLVRGELARIVVVEQLRRAGVRRFGAAELTDAPTCSVHHRSGRQHGHRPRPVARSAAAVAGAGWLIARLGVLVGLSMPGFDPSAGAGGEEPIDGAPIDEAPIDETQNRQQQQQPYDPAIDAPVADDGGGFCSWCDCDCCCDCDGCDCDC